MNSLIYKIIKATKMWNAFDLASEFEIIMHKYLLVQCTKTHLIDLLCHDQMPKQYYDCRHLSYLIGVGVSRSQNSTLTLGTSLIYLKSRTWPLSTSSKCIKEL